MDTPGYNDQAPEGILLGDSDTPEEIDGGSFASNDDPRKRDAQGSDSSYADDADLEDSEDEYEEDASDSDYEDDSSDDDESDDSDDDVEDDGTLDALDDSGLAENETVPSSETDFPGDTPLS